MNNPTTRAPDRDPRLGLLKKVTSFGLIARKAQRTHMYAAPSSLLANLLDGPFLPKTQDRFEPPARVNKIHWVKVGNVLCFLE